MSKNGSFMRFAALTLALLSCHSAALAAERSTGTFPGAFDRPASREQPALTADERTKLKDELTKARDRQNAQVKGKEATPAAKPKKR